MSTLIAFFASILAIPASLGIGFDESTCHTSEFTTLMYHHIREYDSLSPEAKNISVSPEEFRAQMKFLHDNKYQTITSQDIREGTVPCKSVMITFDDGHYDVFTQAYPIMHQYNFRGILGLIPDRIDTSDYLFGPDIRSLQESGWEIASHTWHHPNLSELPRENISYEIQKSKTDLEKWFHTQIHIFVYPKGRYTYYTLDKIRESGYGYAFTTQTGKSNLADKPLELKRFDITPGLTPEKFAQLLEPATPISEK